MSVLSISLAGSDFGANDGSTYPPRRISMGSPCAAHTAGSGPLRSRILANWLGGASAGMVKALVRLAAALPRDLGYAVMVVLYTVLRGADATTRCCAPTSMAATVSTRRGLG